MQTPSPVPSAPGASLLNLIHALTLLLNPPLTKNNNASTHTLSYINKPKASGSRSAPPGKVPASEFQCDCPPHFNLCHLHELPLPGGPPLPYWAQELLLGKNGPSLGGRTSNGRPLNSWGPAMDAFPPQHGGGNNYYYDDNAAPLPHDPTPQDDICKALKCLKCEGKLDIQNPESFHGCDPHK
ncbi:hypothetical protein C0993_000491 [Termitomyces sp. T159_Od127]|nr:hypothetical protein C0993_000491 [Termitomyces sp. T159_Od127]